MASFFASLQSILKVFGYIKSAYKAIKNLIHSIALYRIKKKYEKEVKKVDEVATEIDRVVQSDLAQEEKDKLLKESHKKLHGRNKK